MLHNCVIMESGVFEPMLRYQVLLTPELGEKIKQISRRQRISKSEAVRQLLNLSLGQRKTRQAKAGEGRWIYDLSSYPVKNQRIDGFREIYTSGGRTVEVRIVGPEVFAYYRQHKRLPPGVDVEIARMAQTLKGMSAQGKLVVRRAYVVPGLDNPPGPRFLGLKTTEVVAAVKQIFDFALENEYHLSPKSQIAALVHPFVDPEPVAVPMKFGQALPYGGYAVPLNKTASRVEVFAVWGNNEGVQSFDAIDRYLVDTKRQIIMDKNVPQKDVMLCTTSSSQSERVTVPVDRQFEQVLSDSEILEAGRLVGELTAKFGLRRVEFSYDGREGIVFNEAAKYEITDKKRRDVDKRGRVVVVASQKDIDEIKGLSGAGVEETIVYIDRSIVEERSYDLLNNIAGLYNKFTVLYPGFSATAHAMRILNDFGHTAVVVGNRTFKAGDEIVVKMVDGEITIESLAENKSGNSAVNLYDARLFGREMVGGKAFNLSLLKARGFRVPHGWVITTKVFGQDLEKLWPVIAGKLELQLGKRYAVRSSANIEDQLEHSFAGQFKTFLGVEAGEVKEKVAQVMASVSDQHVTTYRNMVNAEHPLKMAVVVQEMVEADKSGVIFGKDLQTGNPDYVVIDVARGLGEGVVDGVAKSERIVYSRNKNEVINKYAHERKLLSKVEINALIEMAFSLERLMGKTQDIEWAFDETGGVWIVQTRDL